MYKIGDNVLYPMQGAGTIVDMEEQLVLGEKKLYYIMKMPDDDMKIMIPTDTCDRIGVRSVITSDEGLRVLDYFRNQPVESEENWNKRHRDNMSKLRTGDIYQAAEVVKTLMYRDRTKGLSTSERKTLNVSKQIVMTELILSGTAQKDDIMSIMTDTIEELLSI